MSIFARNCNTIKEQIYWCQAQNDWLFIKLRTKISETQLILQAAECIFMCVCVCGYFVISSINLLFFCLKSQIYEANEKHMRTRPCSRSNWNCNINQGRSFIPTNSLLVNSSSNKTQPYNVCCRTLFQLLAMLFRVHTSIS